MSVRRIAAKATRIVLACSLAAGALAAGAAPGSAAPGAPGPKLCIDTDPNSESVPATATRDITAFVTKGAFDAAGDGGDAPGEVSNDCGGNPSEGVSITFTITDDAPDAALLPDTGDGENLETVTTDAAGRATVTLDDKPDAEGSNTVGTDVQGTDSEKGDRDVEKTWVVTPTVTIEISVGVDHPQGYQALKERSLTVPAGANVFGILNRAVEEHFILFYTTEPLFCIDGLCALPLPPVDVFVCGAYAYVSVSTRWQIRETPGGTRYGLADEGDRFDFAYQFDTDRRLRLLVC